MATAAILTIGNELVSGDVPNTNGSWLSMPDEAIFRLDQRYGGVTIVDWLDGVPLVRLMNGALP